MLSIENLSSANAVSCLVMKKHRPMPEGALELVARRFAVLAEPMRLRLLQALFDGEKNVTALVGLTGGTQANISRHLQTLTEAHLLRRRKAGLQVFYAIADPSIYQLCELVCGSLEKRFTEQAEAFGPR
jgi:ArsR family transcriptional regulator